MSNPPATNHQPLATVKSAASWAVPSLLCLILYWPGLTAWFQQDDFVWLNLPNQAHGWDGLLRAVFQPNVMQGSWRPLSERAFFLVFGAWFGADALPYRIWVFLTEFANLALAASITTRLTGSRAAGFLAAVLWVANSKLATAMSWTSAYNQVLCGFFLLLAFHFFLRYTETAARRNYILTWCAFLTGFLAMEFNAIFPLLAASYALLFARKYLRATIPFLAVSVLYAVLHFTLAPNHAQQYAIHLDRSLPHTLWVYWRGTFEPSDLHFLSRFSRIFIPLTMAASTIALLAFTVFQAARRQWLALVLLAWYAIALAPVLPLRDHISEYYLTLPALFMAMLAAYGIACAWRSSLPAKVLAVALMGAFFCGSLPAARRRAEWFRDRSEAQESVVMGVARAHELHPGKIILLDGVDDSLFSQLISQHPFLYLRISGVYLAPGTEARIGPHPEWDVAQFILPAADTRRLLERDEIEVYRVGPGPLRNITHEYAVPARAAGAANGLRVDLADPLAADSLGPEWYGPESGFRWMPRSASVRMPGTWTAGQKLYVTALCPTAQFARGPLEMAVTVNGVRLPAVRFTKGDAATTFAFELRAPGAGDTDIRLEVGRTVRIGADRRDLGMAVVRLEIK
ncbi:MAG: hypothetical protein ACLP59_00990 [Bryobacteraceae bacterium]